MIWAGGETAGKAVQRFSLGGDQFYDLFPFHMVLDTELRVTQVGSAMERLFPGLRPGTHVADFFNVSAGHG